MLEMTNENFARLLRGLTIAVGNRRNRILLYQFLAAEIRALHCSYEVGDEESYKRALTFLENCERFTLRSLVRRSAKHHAEVTVDHAKRVFSRALKSSIPRKGSKPGSGGTLTAEFGFPQRVDEDRGASRCDEASRYTDRPVATSPVEFKHEARDAVRGRMLGVEI